MWFAINIHKDKEETADYLLKICQHLRPEAYFQPEPDAVSTDFLNTVESQLGRKLTLEERAALNMPEEVIDDVDIIERA